MHQGRQGFETAREAQGPGAEVRVLMLQGPPGRFWSELGDAFADAGHALFHVRICTGDRVFWRPRRARRAPDDYRGRLSGFRAWIEAYIRRHGITHVLYYADRLPYHVAAAEAAEAAGAAAVAVEHGYLRPDWVTLERRGMGAFSHFPADPDGVRRVAAEARAAGTDPDLKVRHGHDFWTEAVPDVIFNLSNSLAAWPHPFYRMDTHYHPLAHFLSVAMRMPGAGRRARAAARAVRGLVRGGAPFALIAMQIQSDYQLRDNAPYGHLSEPLEELMASFARAAPPEMRLVVKLHPFDNGMERWERVARRLARTHGIADRVDVIEGGSLDALLAHARGVASVNSTVGVHALRRGDPVLALGAALYDMPGLTHQGPLDAFWTAPEAPDPALVEDFVLALAHAIQVKGSLYDPEGRARAAAEIVARVAGGRINPGAAFLPTPPRLPVRPRPA